VAEADADQRDLRGEGLADEILRGADPVEIVVDAVFRAGDQPALGLRRVGGDLAQRRAPDGEVEAMAGKQAGEHVGVEAVRLLQVLRRKAHLQNADAHALAS
jgi:hypothetical protein